MTIIQAISEGSLVWLVLGCAFVLVLAVAAFREALSRANDAVKRFDEGE